KAAFHDIADMLQVDGIAHDLGGAAGVLIVKFGLVKPGEIELDGLIERVDIIIEQGNGTARAWTRIAQSLEAPLQHAQHDIADAQRLAGSSGRGDGGRIENAVV